MTEKEKRAYRDGHLIGWDEGREDLIDEIITKIDKMPSELTEDGREMVERKGIYQIIEKIIKRV